MDRNCSDHLSNKGNSAMQCRIAKHPDTPSGEAVLEGTGRCENGEGKTGGSYSNVSLSSNEEQETSSGLGSADTTSSSSNGGEDNDSGISGTRGSFGEKKVKDKATKLLSQNGGGPQTYSDGESLQEKLPYPKSVFFIIGNEFCERFSYYGMKAILTLYLKYQLLYTEDDSTIIYHVWSMLCYFMPVVGAIVADTFLGKFRTIFYISLVYALGNIVLSIAAINPIMPNLDTKIAVSLIGLLLIAVGTGGIKPCVSAFGGDQFVLPQQERQLTQFFSIFYFSINAGSLLSTFLTPVLRDDVSCFGDDCYALAFGVPAILMGVAIVLFMAGYALYTIKAPEGNIVVEVSQCIGRALKNRFSSSGTRSNKEHWLDHASDKYSEKLIGEVKILLKVLMLYIPLPFFWALFDQQGSRWTFQATRMSGEVGGWNIKPDQMQVVNPFLILLLIPIFDTVLYPFLGKCGLLKKPLQRIFMGGVLAGVAFLVSGFLELELEKTYPVILKPGESRATFINALPCDVALNAPWMEGESQEIKSFGNLVFQKVHLQNGGNESFSIGIHYLNCDSVQVEKVQSFDILLQNEMAHSLLLTSGENQTVLKSIYPSDDYHKTQDGMPKLRMIFNLDNKDFSGNQSVLLKGYSEKYEFLIPGGAGSHINGTDFQEVHSDVYDVYLPDSFGHASEPSGQLNIKFGGCYNFLVQGAMNGHEMVVEQFEITPPNSVHMLWLIPQYIIMTTGEVMFSVTGLEFSFTQAPTSMKSVLQACWLLTVSFGNLIVVVIAEAKFFDRQALEFFLFAGLMFVDMMAFAVLAMKYKYVEIGNEGKSDQGKKEINGSENKGFEAEETNF
ncbi:solute carrier family 15 member 1-like isoform X2 [Oratosquilla oratoria]|uniref:solute carrier family 15 member 1-like isoform X2 n=1 Tax=Oratosquilla oratoria TaxID=337810 RepID=UPI003F770C5B